MKRFPTILVVDSRNPSMQIRNNLELRSVTRPIPAITFRTSAPLSFRILRSGPNIFTTTVAVVPVSVSSMRSEMNCMTFPQATRNLARFIDIGHSVAAEFSLEGFGETPIG